PLLVPSSLNGKTAEEDSGHVTQHGHDVPEPGGCPHEFGSPAEGGDGDVRDLFGRLCQWCGGFARGEFRVYLAGTDHGQVHTVRAQRFTEPEVETIGTRLARSVDEV